VYPVPLAQFTQDISAACTPTIVSFANNSIGGNQFDWQFSNGNNSVIQQPAPEQFVNTILVPDSTQNTLLVTNLFGCSDQADESLVVYPEVTYQLPTPDTGCHPLAINWQASGIGGDFFQWEMGDGTIINQQNPQHTYQNLSHVASSSYKAKLLATSIYGCTYEDSIEVQVHPVPLAQFVQTAPNGCTPFSLGFTNTSIGATIFSWDFGNGGNSNLQSPSNEVFTNAFATPDSVNNLLVVTNPQGCSDTTSNSLIVFPDVFASFTADTIGCHPFTTAFVNSSSGATSFTWNFDNGNISSIPAPTETFLNNGVGPLTYNVEMYAFSQFGCSDTADLHITVNHKPQASFGITGSQGCSPYEIEVTHTSLNADYLDWNFDDGTTLSSGLPLISHTYTNGSTIPITYNLELVASTIDGCADTAFQPVTVNPAIEANFLADTIGCSPLTINTTNISIGAAAYQWSYGNGNGSNLSSPIITYENSTPNEIDYTLQLITNSAFGCSDTIQKIITVFPEPIALFSANPQTLIYPDNTVGITNLTNGTWNYNWEFGDGTVSTIEQPDSITYGGVGEYRILLEISNDFCNDTSSKIIRIVPPPPIADFIGSGEGCVPLTINFENNSQYASGFLWEFGDGNSSGLSNPKYTYFQPGTYTVRLIAEGPNGTDEMLKIDSVVVHPTATAYFDATPEVVSVPGQGVQFFNLSTNASIYTWNFGDGNQSEEEQPNYFYQRPGEYYPQLIAQNEFNCPDTFSIELPITAEADGKIDFPNVFTPDPNSTSSDGYYTPGRFNATIFHPVITGVEQYHLTIYNRWGELVFETRDQNQGWNGYYRGDIAQQDAYVWKADVVFINGSEETFVGDVTLLR
jgi:gliding motility-associated-like protein